MAEKATTVLAHDLGFFEKILAHFRNRATVRHPSNQLPIVFQCFSTIT
jgi:hypothetical protein